MLLYENILMDDSMADQLWKIVKIYAIMWVSEGIWVICAKPPFLHSLDVPINVFINSLTVWTTMFIAFKHSWQKVVWLFGSG